MILLLLVALLLSGVYALRWLHLPEREEKRARKQVAELLEAHPRSANELYHLSASAAADGDAYLQRCLLRIAAEKGLAQAQYELGTHYLRGNNGFAKNLELGVKWLTEAARQGDAEHQYALGCYYEKTAENAKGEKKQEMSRLAAMWYLEAAERGNGKAQHQMGSFYSTGTGVEKDLEKAEKWYLRAERQGEFVGIGLVKLYDETDHPEKAIRQLHKILAKVGYHAPLYDTFGLGELKRQKKKLEEKRNKQKKERTKKGENAGSRGNVEGAFPGLLGIAR